MMNQELKLIWKEMEISHFVASPSRINREEISQKNRMYSFYENGGIMTPTPCDSILRLGNPCTQEVGKFLTSESADKNKKKVSRIIGWGLRRFSNIVCQKVQAKGRTTYNEVADEIIADLATLDKFDEKNIRRRVYDAFNVLLAINVIAKDKKEIHWIGFPNTNSKAFEDLKKRHTNLTDRIHEKANYLKELEAKTNSKATVEIEISKDMQLAHFDFNGSPFSLHDEATILRMMRCPQAVAGAQFFRGPERAPNSIIRDKNGIPMRPVCFSWNSDSLAR